MLPIPDLRVQDNRQLWRSVFHRRGQVIDFMKLLRATALPPTAAAKLDTFLYRYIKLVATRLMTLCCGS